GVAIFVALVAVLRPAPSRADNPATPKAHRDASGDSLTKARALDRWGDRAGALRILAARAQAEPKDVEARQLYGVLLSAEGRHDDARTELERVLSADPGRAVARRALIHVEL